MRYIFIDRILSLHDDTSILAVKAITGSEDFFMDHFPGNPVFPGALIIETAAQVGTALLEVSSNYTKKAFLIMVQEAKFRTLVRPGTTLIIELEVTDSGAEFVKTDCIVIARTPDREDERAATLSLTFGLKPVGDFYSTDVQRYLRMTYDNWLAGAKRITTTD